MPNKTRGEIMKRKKDYVNKEVLPGRCPDCHCREIEYGEFVFEFFDSGHYEGKCTNCNTVFIEKYDLDFCGIEEV